MKPIHVFNHTLHKAMWNWLAENPDKDKDEWPGMNDLTKRKRFILITYHNCFACLAVGHFAYLPAPEKKKACKLCPLQWETGTNKRETALCESETAQYWRFKEAQYAENYELASKIAREIANLPIREPEGIALVVI